MKRLYSYQLEQMFKKDKKELELYLKSTDSETAARIIEDICTYFSFIYIESSKNKEDHCWKFIIKELLKKSVAPIDISIVNRNTKGNSIPNWAKSFSFIEYSLTYSIKENDIVIPKDEIEKIIQDNSYGLLGLCWNKDNKLVVMPCITTEYEYCTKNIISQLGYRYIEDVLPLIPEPYSNEYEGEDEKEKLMIHSCLKELEKKEKNGYYYFENIN
ncbi:MULTISPECIES: hypothetical protein [unclassified Clostridium]|uniref:hypothetical protein n=1 Tax=unclassified Clostridium TaxID=2614128 RepID=UPI0025BCA8BF|nr:MULTISPECIES: hypothetical protein [unclassified Clostridium]